MQTKRFEWEQKRKRDDVSDDGVDERKPTEGATTALVVNAMNLQENSKW